MEALQSVVFGRGQTTGWWNQAHTPYWTFT